MPPRAPPRGRGLGLIAFGVAGKAGLATARQNATRGRISGPRPRVLPAIQENLKCVLPTPDFCAIGPARAARRRAALFIRTRCWLNWPNTFGDAGWSSPVARQAHNLKVVSSNLAPATNLSAWNFERKRTAVRRFFVCSSVLRATSIPSDIFSACSMNYQFVCDSFVAITISSTSHRRLMKRRLCSC